jgi:glycine/D-amino acid oxidase-like deaminating enzyme
MPHTVIVGAGIIGVSTAYFLSHAPARTQDHTITILDPSPPASGASGKSGGFVGRNWAGAATASLAELSFRLHNELAQKYNGAEKWGYRRCRAMSVVGKNARGNPLGDLTRSVRLRNASEAEPAAGLSWIKPGVIQTQNILSDKDATAQWYYFRVVDVIDCSDPYRLTSFLLEEAMSSGMVNFVQGSATSLFTDENNSVTQIHGARKDGTTLSLACDNVVIAAGAWTGPFSRYLLPKEIPISSYAGHSVVVTPSTSVTADCLFMTLDIRNSFYHPEIFARSCGEVYICGVNDALTLPPNPEAAVPRENDIQKLKEIADTILSAYTKRNNYASDP